MPMLGCFHADQTIFRYVLDKQRKLYYSNGCARNGCLRNPLECFVCCTGFRWERTRGKESYMPTIMRQINMISRCEGLYRTDKLRARSLEPATIATFLSFAGIPEFLRRSLQGTSASIKAVLPVTLLIWRSMGMLAVLTVNRTNGSHWYIQRKKCGRCFPM